MIGQTTWAPPWSGTGAIGPLGLGAASTKVEPNSPSFRLSKRCRQSAPLDSELFDGVCVQNLRDLSDFSPGGDAPGAFDLPGAAVGDLVVHVHAGADVAGDDPHLLADGGGLGGGGGGALQLHVAVLLVHLAQRPARAVDEQAVAA